MQEKSKEMREKQLNNCTHHCGQRARIGRTHQQWWEACPHLGRTQWWRYICIFRCMSSEMTKLFIECVIQMLDLQSIPSRSRKSAQIYAVGSNNIYLPIYEISRPQMAPFPPNSTNAVEIQECCFVYPCLHLPPSYKLSPLSRPSSRLPRHLGHLTRL
jgi:hypothetical protein